jgi:hypothetical protein
MAVGFSSNGKVDLESLRARLRKKSEAELQRYIGAAECMSSPHANFGKPPRQALVIQLQEARAEWDRRTGGGQTRIQDESDR